MIVVEHLYENPKVAFHYHIFLLFLEYMQQPSLFLQNIHHMLLYLYHHYDMSFPKLFMAHLLIHLQVALHLLLSLLERLHKWQSIFCLLNLFFLYSNVFVPFNICIAYFGFIDINTLHIYIPLSFVSILYFNFIFSSS